MSDSTIKPAFSLICLELFRPGVGETNFASDGRVWLSVEQNLRGTHRVWVAEGVSTNGLYIICRRQLSHDKWEVGSVKRNEKRQGGK